MASRLIRWDGFRLLILTRRRVWYRRSILGSTYPPIIVRMKFRIRLMRSMILLRCRRVRQKTSHRKSMMCPRTLLLRAILNRRRILVSALIIVSLLFVSRLIWIRLRSLISLRVTIMKRKLSPFWVRLLRNIALINHVRWLITLVIPLRRRLGIWLAIILVRILLSERRMSLLVG